MPFSWSTTAIDGVLLLQATKFNDDRGYFAELYSKHALAELGLPEFVQDNLSVSGQGIIRGLHYQSQPHPQGKLVCCLQGAIYDVAVDLRQGSPTYGQHVAEVLSGDNAKMLYIPAGFAHGFQALEPNTMVCYKVSGQYSVACERGLAYNDPQLAVAWPLEGDLLSDKDRQWPTLEGITPEAP